MKERPMVWAFIGCLLGMIVASRNIVPVAAISLTLGFLGLGLWIRKRSLVVTVFLLMTAMGSVCYGLKDTQVREMMLVMERHTPSNLRGKVQSKTVGERAITYLVRGDDRKQYLVSTKEKKEIVPGDVINIYGTPKRILGPTNPGEFSAKDYYYSQDIYYRIYANTLERQIKHEDSYSYGRYLVQEFVKQQLQQQYPKETSGLLQGMMLGDKSLIDEETKTDFRQSGLIHLMAVSGLHISLIGGGVYRLLRRMGGGFALSGIVAIVIGFGYCELTGSSLSARRALLMLGVYLFAQVLGKAYDLLSSASFAGIILLIANPYAFYHQGFLLSFTAIFIIGTYGLYRIQWKKYHKVKDALCFSFVLWLGMFPVTAYTQYQVPCLSFLANAIAVPLASIGFSGAVFAIVLPKTIIHLVLSWVFHLVLLISKQSYGLLTIGRVSMLWVMMCYLLLPIWLNKKWRLRGKCIASYCLLLTLVAMVSFRPTTMTFLDVGQGDSTVIAYPGGVMMVDGGSSSKKEVGKYTILNYLRYAGYDHVTLALITHTDSDHYSGILELLAMGKISYLVMPEVEQDEAYKQIVKVAKQTKTTVIQMKKGNGIQTKDINLKVIHPEGKTNLEKNAASLVLSGKVMDVQVLLTGDLELEGEEEVANKNLPKVDILKVGHHGSKNGSKEELLHKISPRLSVISCGLNNRYGHPHEETLKRLKEAGTTICRTDKQGALVVRDNQIVTWKSVDDILDKDRK